MSTETGAWMPLYWADYVADTMHLSTEEHGAYLLLICAYWRRGKPLPDDDEFLAAVTKLSKFRWKNFRKKLLGFFEVVDGEWYHKRLEKEIVKSSARLASARAAGKAGGLAKSKLVTVTTRKKKEGAIKNVSQENEFNNWYSLTPLKRGKGQARKAYKAALKKTDHETLNAGIVRYAREVAGKDDEFIAHPATWLNGERWLDEPERKPHGNQHRGNGARRPSAHDTMLAAHAFAATSRPDAGTGDDIPPDGGGKGDAGKPAARVPRLPSARRAD